MGFLLLPQSKPLAQPPSHSHPSGMEPDTSAQHPTTRTGRGVLEASFKLYQEGEPSIETAAHTRADVNSAASWQQDYLEEDLAQFHIVPEPVRTS